MIPEEKPAIVFPPSRRSDIQPFRVMEILARANRYQAEGRDIIHMEAGQPCRAAPERVREAAARAILGSLAGYTEALGTPTLRARIAAYYGERYGLDIAPARVVVTTGSSAGFVLAFLAIFDHAARVGLSAPYYPAYPNILRALDIEPVILPTGSNSGYQPSGELIEATGARLDGFLVASPANPTGSMLPDAELAHIAELCHERRMAFISDEIYHGITYAESAQTALRFSDEAIVVNSFSKYFCMTGWRLGWLVVPERLERSLDRLAQNLYISPPTVSQTAALVAFECCGELDQNVAMYAENRAYLLEHLPRIGLPDIAPADGAFYLYADISHLTDDAERFCLAMLDDIGVASTPGTDFDSGARARRVRFSYAGEPASVREAVARLGPWLAKKKSA